LVWTPPSKLALIISLFIMLIGIFLGIIGFLDIIGTLPTEISQLIHNYNQILVWSSWCLGLISWIITFIAVKIKSF